MPYRRHAHYLWRNKEERRHKMAVAGWVFGVVANARNSKGFFEGERVELTVMKTGWRVDV